jgi:hypothetical protein
MAARMIVAYYCRLSDTKEMFESLHISKHPSYAEHLNRHDTVYLNMQFFLSRAVKAKTENPSNPLNIATIMTEFIRKFVIKELLSAYSSID